MSCRHKKRQRKLVEEIEFAISSRKRDWIRAMRVGVREKEIPTVDPKRPSRIWWALFRLVFCFAQRLRAYQSRPVKSKEKVLEETQLKVIEILSVPNTKQLTDHDVWMLCEKHQLGLFEGNRANTLQLSAAFSWIQSGGTRVWQKRFPRNNRKLLQGGEPDGLSETNPGCLCWSHERSLFWEQTTGLSKKCVFFFQKPFET